MKNGDMPVAPVFEDSAKFFKFIDGTKGRMNLYGLTKREHFAGLAMQGILSSTPGTSSGDASLLFSAAVNIADALLAELDKGGE